MSEAPWKQGELQLTWSIGWLTTYVLRSYVDILTPLAQQNIFIKEWHRITILDSGAIYIYIRKHNIYKQDSLLFT